MGEGAPLTHPGRAVAPVFIAFSKAAKPLFCMHLGVQQRSWCVWFDWPLVGWNSGANKLYYSDISSLSKGDPTESLKAPFLFACFNHHHHHHQREAPPTFQVIRCLTWKPLAQLPLFQHVLLHTEPPVANLIFLWPL